jgi:NAD(P)-dependent dehydrogenase (short-subunit alcohol dehydrogenase family)
MKSGIEMPFEINAVPDQSGKVAIVTGANTGLGYETTRALAAKNMTVVMACRNAEKAEAARQQLLTQQPDAQLDVLVLDLSSLASVRQFADSFLARYDRLDQLINNAGIMMPPFSLTGDGLESQMAANYFGHFLLTGLLLDRLEGTDGARVVSLSSIAHRNGRINLDDLNSTKRYSRVDAYAQSKLACLMFAFELQRRLEAAGKKTISVAAHPGVADTELSRHFPAWLMKTLGPLLMRVMAHSAQAGAEPTLYAALGEDIRGGDYTGPTGFREVKGRAGRAGAKSFARDPEVASKLWAESERTVGLTFLDSVNS